MSKVDLASGSIDLKSLNIAGESNKYITKIDEGGIKIHDAGDLTRYMLLDADGVDIFINTDYPIASFNNNGLSITPDKDFYGPRGFYINKRAEYNLSNDTSVISGKTYYRYNNGTYEKINNPSGNPSEQNYFEFNSYSINIFHKKVTIDGEASTAINNSFAWGDGHTRSHTVGTSGVDEHGDPWIHKETYTEFYPTAAVGKFSFAQGAGARASGDYSAALGTCVEASEEGQLAIGQYSEIDSDALFIIGNGDRAIETMNGEFVSGNKNLFVVKKNGDLEVTDGFKIIPAASNSGYLQLDYHSLQLISKEGDTYFHVSDLRDENGYLTDNFTGDGEENMFMFSVYGCDSVIKVTIDGVEQEQDTYYYFLDHITFNEAPGNNAEIIVIYTVATTKCQALTFGNRKENQSIGIYSIALGDNNSARGICSSAIGRNVTTGGDYSLAIGNSISAMGHGTIATGIDAREQVQIGTSYNAQGAIVGGYISSLAKSNSYITNGGKGSIVVGCIEDGGDMGSSSFGTAALGIGTWALGKGQTVIGTFNSLDTQGNTSNHPKNTDPAYTKYAFIIGNGYYDTTNDEEIRSNALTVDWNGNVNIAGTYKRNGKNFLVVESKSFNWTFAASTSQEKTGDVSKTGYTPIGIVGFDINNQTSGGHGSSLRVMACRLNGTNVLFQAQNDSTSSAAQTIYFWVLYMAT